MPGWTLPGRGGFSSWQLECVRLWRRSQLSFGVPLDARVAGLRHGWQVAPVGAARLVGLHQLSGDHAVPEIVSLGDFLPAPEWLGTELAPVVNLDPTSFPGYPV